MKQFAKHFVIAYLVIRFARWLMFVLSPTAYRG